MFKDHQPLIAQHARTPEGFADVVSFAIASANQKFHAVKGFMDAIREDRMHDARMLCGWQKNAIQYIRDYPSRIFKECQELTRYDHSNVDAELLCKLTELPGLGFVKAGFVAQLCFGRIGCIDTHNKKLLRAMGIDPKTFTRSHGVSTKFLRIRAQRYIDVCHDLGGCEQLWNTWCCLIACKYPTYFHNADHVSAYHVQCVTGQETVNGSTWVLGRDIA